jgi:hypothetical protein
MHVGVCMYKDIYITIVCICCTYLHAYTHVCGYVRTHCAHRYRYVCVPRQMTRISMGARVCIALRSCEYIFGGQSIYIEIHKRRSIYLNLDTCIWERHRDARVGVRLCGCVRGSARVGCICLRYNHRSERIGVSNTCMRVCACACMVTFYGCGPFEPMSAHCCAAGAAARACGARQVDPIHEGEGASRVARAVQALRVPVRPAAASPPPPPCAFVAVPTLLRVRAAPGAGPAPRGVDAAAAVLPVVAAPSLCAHVCAGGRPARVRGGAGAARRGRSVARRYAYNTELAALPAAADWPNLIAL